MASIIVPGAENLPAKAQAASYEELVAACEGAAPEFIVKQLAGKATVTQAQAAFVADLKAQTEKAKTDAAAARKEADEQKKLAEARRRKPGVKALGDDGRKENDKNKSEDDKDEKMEDDDENKKAEDEEKDMEADEDDDKEDVKQRFAAKVRHYMTTRKVERSGSADKPGAIQLVAINCPNLHKAYLKAINPGRKMSRLLDEKFEDVA